MGVTLLTLFRNQSPSRWSRLSASLVGLWGAVWLVGSQHRAMALSQWQFNPKTHQLQFRWESKRVPRTFVLANPTRIVIDLPQTTLEQKPINKTYPGLVSEIRIAQFQPKTTRIVLELSPEAKLHSETVTLNNISTASGNQWQLTPQIQTKAFSLSSLLKLPPANPRQVEPNQQLVQVPPPPSTQRKSPALTSPSELSLASGTEFRLRYRGKKPLTLEVGQPWQEVLFLVENLTNQDGELIAPAQTPVIGHFKTTPQGTRFITQALITTLEPATASYLESVIPLKSRSSLFRDQTASSTWQNVTIPPNTVFTVELTEDWHYQDDTDN